MSQRPALIGVGEAAAMLRVSKATVYGYVHRGLLKPFTRGILFLSVDVEKLRGLPVGRPKKNNIAREKVE